MKKILTVLSVVLTSLVLMSCGKSEEKVEAVKVEDNKIVFKLGHVSPADYPASEALQFFADEVARKSNGDITVEIYTDGQLGQEKDVLESIKFGTVDMTRVNGGAMASFVPEYAGLTVPFIFRSEEHYWNVLDGEVGKLIAKKAEGAGYKLLAYMDEGSRNVYTTKAPVLKVEDLVGMKIRTTSSQASQDGFEALGAAPTPINYGEVYTSLQQGVVDGAENNYSSYFTSKHCEIAKYISNTSHLRVPGPFLMSIKKWNKLTPKQQAILQETADETKVWCANRFAEKESEYLQKAIDAGSIYTEIPASELARFSEKANAVFDQYREKVGSEVIDGILNTK